MGETFRRSIGWAVGIALVTALIAMVLSILSTNILQSLPWNGGLLVVFVIVIIGVAFDMLGLAAAAAREIPFHSMASRKIAGARHAIGVIRKADKFATFCNDVVGDISGIISGAAGAAVVVALVNDYDGLSSRWFLEVGMVSVLSAFTVGGKALGKAYSIRYANEIIFRVGKFLYILEKKFHIRLFDVQPKKKKRKRKRGVLREPRTD
ncbi:hypothetical protein [Mechercharimyces sp. CAU 1602]|uniref:hypothetical protein n=1 Tax=Mechercharimyces sp. CAU 1602 TaxID=2973933 RepID=UPI002162D78A|nr:hypothetical protein [Mechercharimyces sp. CAU 1602]MCS1350789.1 hypothetical protein [Mechercharimyces sp. CAU 1602]